MEKPHFIGRHFTLFITDGNDPREFKPIGESKAPLKGLFRDLTLTGTIELTGESLSSLRSISEEAAEHHARWLAAETDRQLAAALADDPNARLWRSDAKFDEDSFSYVYQFQVLPMGAPAPAAGLIFGPA